MSYPGRPESSALDANVERWGLGDLGWLGLAIVVCGIGAVAATEWLGQGEQSSAFDVLFAVAFLTPLTFVPIVAARRKGSGWRSAYQFTLNRRSLAVGALAAAASVVAVGLALEVVEPLQGRSVTSGTTEDLAAASGAAYFLLLLLAGVWAPFAEEVAFRGLLWSAAIKRGWSAWVATLISALPFAAIHLEPSRFIPLLLSGLLLGIARQYGGLGAAVVAHLIINGTAAGAALASRT